MASCDFTVKISDEDKPLTLKTRTDIGCGAIDSQTPLVIKDASTGGSSIATLSDVDTTYSSANGTVLVWDASRSLFVRKLLDASFLSGGSSVYLPITGGALTGNLVATNISLSGDLSVAGDIVLKGDTIRLGDGGDVLNIGASVNNHFVPTSTATFDLGSSGSTWRTVYARNVSVSDGLSLSGDFILTGDTFNLGDSNTVVNFNATVNNHIYPTTTGVYNLGSTSARWGTFYGIDVDLTGNLTVDGDIILKGSTLTLGDGGDVINIGASVNSHIVTTTDSTYDLGTDSTRWRNVYADYYYGDGRYIDHVAISRSQTGDAPASLANGELHYSFSSDKLYIGQTDNSGSSVSVEYIGGKLLVNKVANLESIVIGGSPSFNNITIDGILQLTGYPENAALRTKANGVVEAITGNFGEVFQVSANGSPYFDDLNGGTY